MFLFIIFLPITACIICIGLLMAFVYKKEHKVFYDYINETEDAEKSYPKGFGYKERMYKKDIRELVKNVSTGDELLKQTLDTIREKEVSEVSKSYEMWRPIWFIYFIILLCSFVYETYSENKALKTYIKEIEIEQRQSIKKPIRSGS